MKAMQVWKPIELGDFVISCRIRQIAREWLEGPQGARQKWHRKWWCAFGSSPSMFFPSLVGRYPRTCEPTKGRKTNLHFMWCARGRTRAPLEIRLRFRFTIFRNLSPANSTIEITLWCLRQHAKSGRHSHPNEVPSGNQSSNVCIFRFGHRGKISKKLWY